MTAADLGPAHGLVADWFTWPFVLLIIAAAGLTLLTAGLVRAADRPAPTPPPLTRHQCPLRTYAGKPCTHLATVMVWDAHHRTLIYVCPGHKADGDMAGWWR